MFLFRVQSYLNYWLRCVDKHSLHSPFFYDFYTKVITSNTKEVNQLAETLRQKLLDNQQTISFTDMGMYKGKKVVTSVHHIAKKSVSHKKFSEIYLKAIQYFSAKQIVELGTSLGINSLYLSYENKTTLHTFEGVAEIAGIARDTFSFAEKTNINLIEGDIQFTLPQFVQKGKKVDFVFIDANHQKEPCLRYFEQLLSISHSKTVFVLDDIHHNPSMKEAWETIKRHPLVYGSADLYRCGFVFLDSSINRQHWQLEV